MQRSMLFQFQKREAEKHPTEKQGSHAVLMVWGWPLHSGAAQHPGLGRDRDFDRYTNSFTQGILLYIHEAAAAGLAPDTTRSAALRESPAA